MYNLINLKEINMVIFYLIIYHINERKIISVLSVTG